MRFEELSDVQRLIDQKVREAPALEFKSGVPLDGDAAKKEQRSAKTTVSETSAHIERLFRVPHVQLLNATSGIPASSAERDLDAARSSRSLLRAGYLRQVDSSAAPVEEL